MLFISANIIDKFFDSSKNVSTSVFSDDVKLINFKKNWNFFKKKEYQLNYFVNDIFLQFLFKPIINIILPSNYKISEKIYNGNVLMNNLKEKKISLTYDQGKLFILIDELSSDKSYRKIIVNLQKQMSFKFIRGVTVIGKYNNQVEKILGTVKSKDSSLQILSYLNNKYSIINDSCTLDLSLHNQISSVTSIMPQNKHLSENEYGILLNSNNAYFIYGDTHSTKISFSSKKLYIEEDENIITLSLENNNCFLKINDNLINQSINLS